MGVGATRCTKSRQGYDPRHPSTQVFFPSVLSLGGADAAVSCLFVSVLGSVLDPSVSDAWFVRKI
jgi:hypothetical protein